MIKPTKKCIYWILYVVLRCLCFQITLHMVDSIHSRFHFHIYGFWTTGRTVKKCWGEAFQQNFEAETQGIILLNCKCTSITSLFGGSDQAFAGYCQTSPFPGSLPDLAPISPFVLLRTWVVQEPVLVRLGSHSERIIKTKVVRVILTMTRKMFYYT